MIIDKLETDNNSESDINADPNKSLVSIEAKFLWRRCRYSIKSIAALLSIPKLKVAEVLTQYRRNVKSQWNLNKRKTKGLRLSVGPDKLQAIKDYWDHPVNRPIKIRDIKHHVWPPSSNEKVPHDSTISRILRNELNMTYKVLQKRNLKTENSSNIRLFHESLAIQVFLRAKDYELIYIDEFSYSLRK